jgi:hypothetical protein
MNQLVKAATALRQLPLPKTLQEWVDGYNVVKAALDLPGMGSNYLRPWFYRTWVLVAMRAAGRPGLKMDQPMSLEEFRKGFPDQGNFILKFGAGLSTIQERHANTSQR